MNKFILVFGLLLVSAIGSLLYAGTPYQPEVDARIGLVETKLSLSGDATVTASGVLSANPATVRKYVRSQYDFAVDGSALGDHALGESVPANAVITRTFLKVNTAFTDASSAANISFGCAGISQTSLFAVNALGNSAVNAVLGGAVGATNANGVATGALALGASACSIIATIPADAGQFSAGAATLFVEYLVSP